MKGRTDFFEGFSMIFLNYAVSGIPLTVLDSTFLNMEDHVGLCL